MSKTEKPKSWRDVLPIHPAADLFPMMSPDELKALGEDIKKNGMNIPVILWSPGTYETERRVADDAIYLIDGRNRLDAAELVGVRVAFVGFGMDRGLPNTARVFLYRDGEKLPEMVSNQCDEAAVPDPFAQVLSLNMHRRHLTAEQKREIVAKVLKAQPEKSNRTIAKQTKADHKTVGAVRDKLEAGGEIPHHDVREDARGTKQPTTKKKRRSVDDFEAEQKAKAVADRAKQVQAVQQVDLEDLLPTGLGFLIRRGDKIIAAFARRTDADDWAQYQSLNQGARHEVLRGRDYLALETYDTGELIVSAQSTAPGARA